MGSQFPSPGGLPNPGIEPRAPALQAEPPGKPTPVWLGPRPVQLAGTRGHPRAPPVTCSEAGSESTPSPPQMLLRAQEEWCPGASRPARLTPLWRWTQRFGGPEILPALKPGGRSATHLLGVAGRAPRPRGGGGLRARLGHGETGASAASGRARRSLEGRPEPGSAGRELGRGGAGGRACEAAFPTQPRPAGAPPRRAGPSSSCL